MQGRDSIHLCDQSRSLVAKWIRVESRPLYLSWAYCFGVPSIRSFGCFMSSVLRPSIVAGRQTNASRGSIKRHCHFERAASCVSGFRAPNEPPLPDAIDACSFKTRKRDRTSGFVFLVSNIKLNSLKAAKRASCAMLSARWRNWDSDIIMFSLHFNIMN